MLPFRPARRRQLAAFLADLTLQKKSEEVLRQTEKLAIAGRLAASIAHEINNPLEAITNCLYLIEQGQMEPDSRNYLQMAQRELDRFEFMLTSVPLNLPGAFGSPANAIAIF